jgi:hypothetical protein
MRLTLRGLKWSAESGSTSLEAVLKSAAQSRLSQTESGKVLVGTAANGHSVTYALPSNGNSLTPASAAEMISYLLDLYDAAKAALGGTPTDTQIFNEMMARLVPAREVHHDHLSLRVGPTPLAA